MDKQKFHVTIIGEIDIELDDEVIKSGSSDEFKYVMGFTMTPQEIANYIAHQIIINNANMENIDGFADKSNDSVKIIDCNWRYDD